MPCGLERRWKYGEDNKGKRQKACSWKQRLFEAGRAVKKTRFWPHHFKRPKIRSSFSGLAPIVSSNSNKVFCFSEGRSRMTDMALRQEGFAKTFKVFSSCKTEAFSFKSQCCHGRNKRIKFRCVLFLRIGREELYRRFSESFCRFSAKRSAFVRYAA